MKRLMSTLLLGGLFALRVDAQNLILNGSFELGPFVQGPTYAGRMQLPDGSTTINNWTVGAAGGNFWWLNAPNYNAQDGSFAIDLDSNQVLPATYIEQSFATTIGQAYQVSAYFASEGNGGPATTSILINGGLIGSLSTGAGTGEAGPDFTDLIWTAGSFTFVATSSSSTLRFVDATAGFYNPIIDNVSVVAVPEPSGLGLFAATLAAWRFGRRVRR